MNSLYHIARCYHEFLKHMQTLRVVIRPNQSNICASTSQKAAIWLCLVLRRNDVISNFQMDRFISTNESLWRLLSFQIHKKYPTVVHLAVHLEKGQRVYFTEANAAQGAERPPSTTLTNCFEMCKGDPFAATQMYVEMPKYYTWNQSTKKFQRCKQGTPVPVTCILFILEMMNVFIYDCCW